MPVDFCALLSECRAVSNRRSLRSAGVEGLSRMRKGEATRKTIVAKALRMASCRGLDAITFGAISHQLGMAKASVFNHFGSREKLLLEVLNLYEAMFKDEVLLPSLTRPAGLPRLASMYVLWTDRFIVRADANCLFISGAITSGVHEGPVREKLVSMVHAWKIELHRCVRQAIRVGHLREDIDPWQIVYETYGLALRLRHGMSLFETTDSVERAMHGFERLIRAYACQKA